MIPGPVYLLSDVHLGVASVDAERDLLALLRSVPREAQGLVINGDLFDFWFEWRHVVPRVGVRVLGALAQLVEDGIPVLWIAGNHDCWGGDVLRRDLGITYHVGPWRGSLGGWDTLIEHGDGLRPREDAPYRRLRTVLRHPLSVRLFRWIHPDWGTALALRSSHTSRNYQPQDRGEGLRVVALERLSAPDAPEAIVFGHSHVPSLERGERGVFANPGAWLDTPRFLRFTPDALDLCRWESGARQVEATLARQR
jgi:UDP-2,3-diacylglucosamine hydrolase